MSRKFQIISPVSGDVYAERDYANPHMISSCFKASEKAFQYWKNTPVEKRREICTAAVVYFREHAKEWGMEVTMQMGRPVRYSPSEIIDGFSERAEFMIECAAEALLPIQLPEKPGFQRYIKKEPLGTVLVFAPWNYPYLTAVNAVVPALMAGNCVILKHSEQTALCAERFFEAFEHAGLPRGVFQYLHLTHSQSATVISEKPVAHIAFTGSVEGGRAIRKAAAGRFISTGLELGGKDPAYVAEDADLDFAAENLADGSFFNSGQSCCGIERIYVHESSYNTFLEKFTEITRKYVLGDPRDKETTLGPMVRKSNAEKAGRAIRQAIQNGAEPLIKKADFPDLGYPWLPPQILINVDHSMAIMKEETFAPVVGIMPVKNDDEAISLMNDSKYGLTASVWTRDPDKAIAIGDRIETGTWFMNRCDYLDPALAWTGVKCSGNGCTLSELGYNYLTRPKSYHLKTGLS
jgi:acyl-CoA reductase-like NAD-dependent aldehyde dehydrogenase